MIYKYDADVYGTPFIQDLNAGPDKHTYTKVEVSNA